MNWKHLHASWWLAECNDVELRIKYMYNFETNQCVAVVKAAGMDG